MRVSSLLLLLALLPLSLFAQEGEEEPLQMRLALIDDLIVPGVEQIGSFAIEIEVQEFRNGNDPDAPVRKIPGVARVSNLTLKRGFTQDPLLWEWFSSVRNPDSTFRRTLTLPVQGQSGATLFRWEFTEAWPSRYQISPPAITEGGTDIGVEDIVIVFEDIKRVF